MSIPFLAPNAGGTHIEPANPPDRPQGFPWFQSPWFLGALLVLAVAGLYANSLHGEWIFDDYRDVLGPESIQGVWPLGRHFLQRTGGLIVTHSRPLASLTFAVDSLFGGNDPFLFHVTNVAIHALATLCLFGLLRRTLLLSSAARTRPTAHLLAFTTALLWAIHPLQTEAVAYITQRYESLMGLFALATLLCVVRSDQSRHPKAWSVAAVCSCLLALASKEVAVVLPLLVLLYDRAFLAGTFRGAWLARRGLYLALAFVEALFLWNQAHVPSRAFAGFTLLVPWWQYAMNQPAVVLHYLRLTVWPHPLVLDYGWAPALSLGPLLPGFLLVGSLLAMTLFAQKRFPRWGFLGAAFFLVLAPTSSILPILDLAVEHRMYLPLAPVLAATIVGLHDLARWIVARQPRWAKALQLSLLLGGSLATVLFGTLTALRSETYRSELALSLDTLLQRPGNPRAHINLAFALNKAGRLDEAVRQARIASQLAPGNTLIRLTLAAFLEQEGQDEEAIQELQEAARRDPRNPKPWLVLGEIHAKTMALERSLECLGTAVALDPRLSQAYLDLGNVRATMGDFPAALGEYRKAIALQPDLSLAHRGSGLVLLKLGRLTDSVQAFEVYVQLERGAPEALVFVGQALYALDQRPEALRYWQRALQRDPRHVPALLSLSWALSTHPRDRVRNGPEALALAEAALRADRDRGPSTLDVLGAAYAEVGRFAEACTVTEEAIQKLETIHSPGLPAVQARLARYRGARPFHTNPSAPHP